MQVSHYAGVACKRLERIGFGGKRQPRKPTTDDIDQARVSIDIFANFLKVFSFSTSFNASLESLLHIGETFCNLPLLLSKGNGQVSKLCVTFQEQSNILV